MNIKALRVIMEARGLNKSQLARMAGVSRQAVSLWFDEERNGLPQISIHSGHLLKLSRSLGISVESLTDPIFPATGQGEYFTNLEKTLLWDRAYSDLISFVVALIKGDERAIARLVQVFGLFQAAKMMGKRIWNSYARYRKYINPIRRMECERIWNLQKNLGLI